VSGVGTAASLIRKKLMNVERRTSNIEYRMLSMEKIIEQFSPSALDVRIDY
jgi:hypothetical protein